MNTNKSRAKTPKSFRITQYNEKHLKKFCEETETTATDLINSLLADYFFNKEREEIQEALKSDLIHYVEW